MFIANGKSERSKLGAHLPVSFKVLQRFAEPPETVSIADPHHPWLKSV